MYLTLVIILCIFTTSFSQQHDSQPAECQKIYQKCYKTCSLGEYCFSPKCKIVPCEVQNEPEYGSGIVEDDIVDQEDIDSLHNSDQHVDNLQFNSTGGGEFYYCFYFISFCDSRKTKGEYFRRKFRRLLFQRIFSYI